MKFIHLKQIWEQFRSNRFFGFLSLFGMSIPVMVIMIMVLKIDLSIHPGGPERNNDQMLFLNQMKITRADGSYAWGGLPVGMIEKHFARMAPQNRLAFSASETTTMFRETNALDLSLRYTNAGFWQVFDFEFLQGHPYTRGNVKDQDNVAVISRSLKERLFNQSEVAGKTLKLDGHTFRVIGVVQKVNSLARNTYAQVWLPYTWRRHSTTTPYYNRTGAYGLTFRSSGGWGFPDIRRQVRDLKRKVNHLNDEGTRVLFAGPAQAAEIYFRAYRDPQAYKGVIMSYIGVAGKALIILLLPALNLVSINLTRIQERSQEIAIRKAFGATRKSLTYRIMGENAVLTLAGGFLGLVLAYLAAFLFKDQIFTAYFVADAQQAMIQMNYGVFFILILVSLIFSILSGWIPAMRISRLNPAYVLKGGAL
mgnify:CR=1 FL=1